MEKLLAMSILSSGPADFSGSTSINRWLTRSWTAKRSAGEENKGCSSSSSSQVQEKKLQVQDKRQGRPRFALELDGLHCFETVVFS